MAIELTTGFAGGALTKTTAVTGISGAASASICCWYYADSFATSSNFVLRLTGAGAADTMCQLYTFTDGSFNWSSDDGTFESLIQQPVVLAQWHHYCVTYTQTSITAYYDGVSIGSASHTFGSRASQIQIVIGKTQGKVQDVLVYSDALTGSDVLEIKRARPPRRMANLVAWYPLWSGARTADYGPDSLTLTETGTINDSLTSAPAPWRGPIQSSALRVYYSQFSSATGGSNRAGAGVAQIVTPAVGAVTRAGAAAASGGKANGGSNRAGTAQAQATARGGVTRDGQAVLGVVATGGSNRAGFAAAQTQATGGVTRAGAASAQAQATGGSIRAGSALAGAAATGGVVRGGSAAADTPATGPALGNRQDTADRRWLGGIGARRNLRR